MVGGTVGEVIASNNPDFAAGDVVLAPTGWQTHAVSDGKGCARSIPKLAPLSTALGVLGMPGMTAYAGLLEIGKPQPGETVVVAAASGPVGSAVGQIAKIKGRAPSASRAGAKKCAYVKDELGLRRLRRPPRAAILPSGSRPLARRASMSISRTSAARCSKRCCRCSTFRARAGVRADLAIQRHRAAAWPNRVPVHVARRADASGSPCAASSSVTSPPSRRISCATGGLAARRPRSNTGRTWPTALSARLQPSSGSSRGEFREDAGAGRARWRLI